MPMRVKCRCGQELVLRYSEWVYVLLGISLLALLLNSVALVLLYFRVESAFTAAHVPQRVEATAPPPPATAPPRGPPERRGDDRSTAAAPSPVKDAGDPPAQPEPAVLPEATPPPAKEPAGGASVRPLRQPESPPLAGGDLLADILFPAQKGADARVTPTGGAGTTAVEKRGQRVRTVLEGAPLFRLAILEQAAGDLTVAAGFLLDPDPRLRRRALELLITEAGKSAAVLSPEARAFVQAARAVFGSDDRFAALLGAAGLANDKGDHDTAPLDIEPGLASLRDGFQRRGSAAPLASLRDLLNATGSSGWDVALVIDSSRSMEGLLDDLKRHAVWLLAALPWAVPDSRVGLVLFRDGVEATADFSNAPEEDVLGLLRDARPEGGGDVPEGVHEAIRGALSLGRLRWRDTAVRHIVLVGDAPPPYAEVPGLLALVRMAHKEGKYRLHALSLRPEEGRKAIPFFNELAEAGGGRAVTLRTMDDWGAELLLCLFPAETHAALREVIPGLRDLFSTRT